MYFSLLLFPQQHGSKEAFSSHALKLKSKLVNPRNSNELLLFSEKCKETIVIKKEWIGFSLVKTSDMKELLRKIIGFPDE